MEEESPNSSQKIINSPKGKKKYSKYKSSGQQLGGPHKAQRGHTLAEEDLTHLVVEDDDHEERERWATEVRKGNLMSNLRPCYKRFACIPYLGIRECYKCYK